MKRSALFFYAAFCYLNTLQLIKKNMRKKKQQKNKFSLNIFREKS